MGIVCFGFYYFNLIYFGFWKQTYRYILFFLVNYIFSSLFIYPSWMYMYLACFVIVIVTLLLYFSVVNIFICNVV